VRLRSDGWATHNLEHGDWVAALWCLEHYTMFAIEDGACAIELRADNNTVLIRRTIHNLTE
jgi:alcohol dehydrogenase YqhD (iron-dependent ADH family)